MPDPGTGVPIQAEWGLTPRRVQRRTLVAEAEVERLRAAATEVSEAWDAWMMDEEGEGQSRVEDAIGALRAVLNA